MFVEHAYFDLNLTEDKRWQEWVSIRVRCLWSTPTLTATWQRTNVDRSGYLLGSDACGARLLWPQLDRGQTWTGVGIYEGLMFVEHAYFDHNLTEDKRWQEWVSVRVWCLWNTPTLTVTWQRTNVDRSGYVSGSDVCEARLLLLLFHRGQTLTGVGIY